MQKKLIALAVAGLMSGAAFAQSNVTIYGVADGSFDSISVSGGVTATNNVSFNRVSTNSSLLGFKGSEDLGGGLKANFQFESAAGFDNLGAIALARDSYAGLSGNWGEVRLGNNSGPSRAWAGAVDPNAGATGIGVAVAALAGKLNNVLTGTGNTANTTLATVVTPVAAGARSATRVGVFDNRLPNSVAYVSPSFSGFQVMGAYATNEGKLDGAAAINPSALDLGMKYANGPIYVALTWADAKIRDVNVNSAAKLNRVIGKYDFGMASLAAMWDSAKFDNATTTAKQNTWVLMGTYNVTANGKLIGSYSKAADATGTNAAVGTGTGAKFYELAYEHSLSKRTMLKGQYARISNSANAAFDFGVNGAGLVSNGARVSGLQLGLRHVF